MTARLSEDRLDAICAAQPGATDTQPFGPETTVWKVRGKMFALYTHAGDGVSIKCASNNAAQILIDLGRASRAPYLDQGGWVMIPWETRDVEMVDRIKTSWRAVVADLPDEVQTDLMTQA